MNAFAAVMTGKGIGAIATVCVVGNGAGEIIKTIFKPAGKSDTQFEIGKIFLGHIVDGEKVIDQVVIGCERENEFAINCHGNPLIVEMIMELLAKHGAEATNAEQLFELQNSKSQMSKIALEARLLQLKAKTIEGYKLLQNQIEGGLTARANEWLKTESLDEIQKQAQAILKASLAADYIINGCKVAIAGPANSGKSTLLNCLAGREKSIVADIPGTTRDWVSATCVSGPLAMEIFDTAGLDESLTIENPIDKAAQQRSIEIVRQADIVIWLVDGTDEKSQISNRKNQIIAVNKSDLGLKIKLDNAVIISAKNGTGIDELTKRIRTVLGVESFDLSQPICFTDRQKQLLQKIAVAKNSQAVQNALINLNQCNP